jgi:hypothetical protein
MPDQPSDVRGVNPEVQSLPEPVLVELSQPWIDPARFAPVIEAFGPLPVDGQIQLARRVIEARGQYLTHRRWAHDEATPQGVRRKRLGEIGAAARRLQQLLHRDGTDPQPWNLHPAITLALPELCRIGSRHRPNQIWNPPQGLSLLAAMLADLVEVEAGTDTVFDTPVPRTHGGPRRESHTPATGLVDRLINIYVDMRSQFLDSGPPPAFGNPLLQFVRAGLAFAVATRTIRLVDEDLEPPEAAYMETNLPTRVTDDAIRGVWARGVHKPK